MNILLIMDLALVTTFFIVITIGILLDKENI
jgi:hypothetical protein